jgi:hypothetical protein
MAPEILDFLFSMSPKDEKARSLIDSVHRNPHELRFVTRFKRNYGRYSLDGIQQAAANLLPAIQNALPANGSELGKAFDQVKRLLEERPVGTEIVSKAETSEKAKTSKIKTVRRRIGASLKAVFSKATFGKSRNKARVPMEPQPQAAKSRAAATAPQLRYAAEHGSFHPKNVLTRVINTIAALEFWRRQRPTPEDTFKHRAHIAEIQAKRQARTAESEEINRLKLGELVDPVKYRGPLKAKLESYHSGHAQALGAYIATAETERPRFHRVKRWVAKMKRSHHERRAAKVTAQ